jgi:hypothetical protein
LVLLGRTASREVPAAVVVDKILDILAVREQVGKEIVVDQVIVFPVVVVVEQVQQVQMLLMDQQEGMAEVDLLVR